MAVAGLAAVLAVPAPAGASDRMSLACEGLGLVVERTNGASWFGDDGRTYTTRHLRIVDESGVYEKAYGHTASAFVVCEADHVAGGYRSRWTVQLVASR